MNVLRNIRVMLGMEAAMVESKSVDGSVFAYDTLEKGSAVFLVSPDGNVPAEIGEYELEDGSKFTVTEPGVIAEVMPAEEKPETEVKPAEEVEAAEVTTVETPVAEVPGVEAETEEPDEKDVKIAALEQAVTAQQQRLVEIEAIIAELTTGFGAFRGDVGRLSEKVAVIAKAPSVPSVFSARKPEEKETAMTPAEKRMNAIGELRRQNKTN